jgi:hypothetical protein
VRRQSEAATALWIRQINDPKRCRAALATALQKVEIVFKDGVGYDSEKIIQSVQGLVGIR